jgi:hypothetical protein
MKLRSLPEAAPPAPGHENTPGDLLRARPGREEAGQVMAARQQAGEITCEPWHVPEAAREPQDAPTWDLDAPGLPDLSCDDLPDGVVITDESGRITVFNAAAARLTGLSRAEAAGRLAPDVLPLYGADGRDWWACADPYHGLVTRTRHPERALYLVGGTEVLATVGYVRGRDLSGASPGPGPVRGLVICLRSGQQRERLERSRADLVSTVAHELRSPLTSIKGFTATMLAKWDRFSDDQKRVMLETVNEDADRVTRLINDLLNVSRIESGRMEVRRQLVNLPDRARRVIAGRVAAGDATDRFRLEAHSSLPETWLDADKTDQILANLVENAVRHGAGTVTVTAEPARLDGEPGLPDAVTLSVRDQGAGISPESQTRVFQQFWRGKRRGGTGLGLYIVKGLVEVQGGTICVQNAHDGGADFRLTLPAGTPPG